MSDHDVLDSRACCAILRILLGLLIPVMAALRINVALSLFTCISMYIRAGGLTASDYWRSEICLLLLIMVCLCKISFVDELAAKHTVAAEHVKQMYSAMHGLLKARCDAVLEL